MICSYAKPVYKFGYGGKTRELNGSRNGGLAYFLRPSESIENFRRTIVATQQYIRTKNLTFLSQHHDRYKNV
jgi:hypothetical protein